MSPTTGIVIGLILLVVAVGMGAWAGHGILGPVNDAVLQARGRLQFKLTDFVWLLIQLQIGLGAVVGYIPREQGPVYWMTLLFVAGAVTVLWLAAIWTMSAAGVSQGGRRAAFVLVLLPGCLALIMGVILWLIIVPFGSLLAVLRFIDSGSGLPASDTLFACAAAVGSALAIALSWFFLRWLSDWILSQRAVSDPVSDSPADSASRADSTSRADSAAEQTR